MKLRYLLNKLTNMKTNHIMIVIVAITLVVLSCFSYAIFTATSEAKGSLNIVTGDLYAEIESTDLNKNKSITLTAGESKTVNIKLKNINNINAKLNLYYSATGNVEIGYLKSGDAAPTQTGYVLGKKDTATDTKNIYVRINNNESSNVTVTFGSNAGLENADLAFPNGKTALSLMTSKNPNITTVYTYNQDGTGTGAEYTGCLGGEEAGCSEVQNLNANSSYPVGTIVKYKVNANEEKYFNVLYDNTDTGILTLQQRENTVYNVAWTSANDNKSGPDNALALIETATKSWTNVNDQTYTMGTTKFRDNFYTGCDSSFLCNTNTYTLQKRSAKARMITLQETLALGCANNNQTCPSWINNYLYSSTSYGASFIDNHVENNESGNYGYWAMNAYSLGEEAGSAWRVNFYGKISGTTTSTLYGARAVVEINK